MKSHAGASHVSVELAHPVHEPRDLDVRQSWTTVDYDQMQADPKLRQPAGARHRVGRGVSPDHQTCG
jgi:hypothetical protein